MVPGVGLPATDVTMAFMGMVAVLSAAIFCEIWDPLPINRPVVASDIAIATRVAVPLFW